MLPLRRYGIKHKFDDWGGGGGGCNIVVRVLGGNGTKIAPIGDILTNPLVKCDEFGASLPTM